MWQIYLRNSLCWEELLKSSRKTQENPTSVLYSTHIYSFVVCFYWTEAYISNSWRQSRNSWSVIQSDLICDVIYTVNYSFLLNTVHTCFDVCHYLFCVTINRTSSKYSIIQYSLSYILSIRKSKSEKYTSVLLSVDLCVRYNVLIWLILSIVLITESLNYCRQKKLNFQVKNRQYKRYIS